MIGGGGAGGAGWVVGEEVPVNVKDRTKSSNRDQASSRIIYYS